MHCGLLQMFKPGWLKCQCLFSKTTISLCVAVLKVKNFVFYLQLENYHQGLNRGWDKVMTATNK